MFKLTDNFLNKYKNLRPDFGFGGLGEFVYYRTYSRRTDDGRKEEFWQTIQRVVEGCYTFQKKHIDDSNLGWNNRQGQFSAQEMYDRMFNMKILPGGRGLWAMGTPLVMEKGITGALYNCSFISTENIDKDASYPFKFFMDVSMLGTGVGVDLKGADKLNIKGPDRRRRNEVFVVPDTRGGWVDSVGALIESYVYGISPVTFDYSQIRVEGEPIKTFGGVCSGYKPLEKLHDKMRGVLDDHIGRELSARGIIDLFNVMGVCVVSGNVRRSATVVVGPNDGEYLDFKNYDINPDRAGHGWASNNSINAEIGMDYSDVAERIISNGEPGILWMDNAVKYGRFADGIRREEDYDNVIGCNPCGEIFLESEEFCNLVEIYLNRHSDMADFLRSIKFAYLYAKSVTLEKLHIVGANRAMLRNRRIGCGVSGVAQFIGTSGVGELREWLDAGYDELRRWDKVYSRWLCIPPSIKMSTVKPSGTTSLMIGSTPGVHYPISRYYVRRVRVAHDDELVLLLKDAGYKVEPAVENPDHTVVVEFPVDVGETIVGNGEISVWEQLSLAALMQRHWADNGVSVTCSFDPDSISKKELVRALDYFQYLIKGVSFLPQTSEYEQMPYEKISKEEYSEMISGIEPVDYAGLSSDGIGVKYCDNEECDV